MRVQSIAVTLAFAAAAAGCAGMITGGPLVSDPNGPTAQITIVNQTPGEINVVLLSRCSASTYGLNRLPKDMAIPAGNRYSFTVSPGCWDVAAGRVGYGDVRERFDTVRAGSTATFTVDGGAR
jgi:hypothetical protein